MADQAATETLDTQDEQQVAAAAQHPDPSSETLVEEQLLVEDVSIDGMCGVY